MTYFARQGNNYSVTPENALDISDRLPAGTYTVKYDDFNSRYFLSMVDGYDVPKKLYGDTKKHSKRILSTFAARSNSTGVLLAGDAGSGKTMLAKKLSIDAMKLDIPTILVNEAWHGEQFNQFMQQIEQPTIVIFDEFEKVYDAKAQESMLTLLDGVYPSKKLFILTCNDTYRINSHMKNRPGRIFYRLNYEGLDRDFIIEYCEDNLKNKSHIDALCRLAMLFSSFNFDMLKAIVEDMNRYDESPREVMQFLNASPEYSDKQTFEITLEHQGKIVPESKLYNQTWTGNPLSGQEIKFSGYFGTRAAQPPRGKRGKKKANWEAELEEDEDVYVNVVFKAEDLKSTDEKEGKFLFENSKGDKLVLTRKKAQKIEWASF